MRKNLPDAQIVLLESSKGEGLSFVGADGLLWVAGLIPEQHLVYTSAEQIRARGIDLRLSCPVNRVDFAAKTVFVGENEEISYDYLILATGSRASAPGSLRAEVEGAIANNLGLGPVRAVVRPANSAIESSQGDLGANASPEARRVQYFKTWEDARNLKALVSSPEIERVGILGGGYIGIETAEAVAKAGKKAVVFQASSLANAYYDESFGELIKEQLEASGVETRLGERFAGFDQIAPEARCDAYVVSLGFEPAAELGGNEIARSEAGAYQVDEYQQTSQDSVFAIGDCTASWNNAARREMYMAIGSATARGACVVANRIGNLASKNSNEFLDVKNQGTQGSNALSIFGLNLSSVGLTLASAQKLGFEARAADFCGTQLAQYLPARLLEGVQELEELAGGKIKLRVVYDSGANVPGGVGANVPGGVGEANADNLRDLTCSGSRGVGKANADNLRDLARPGKRILGAQVASFTDVVMANHLFSLAISQQLAVEDLLALDMFFLPQLNQLYSAVRRCLARVEV